MNIQTHYDNLKKIIEPIIMDADLANLGGVQGEYDRQIDLIIKYILENKEISSDFIKKVFKEYFGDGAANDQEELIDTAERIKAAFLECGIIADRARGYNRIDL